MSKMSLKRNPALIANAQYLTGVWKNELDSTMTISTASLQSISGSYESLVSGSGSPVRGALQGVLSADSIAFIVNWTPTYNSVTSWTGLVLFDSNNNSPFIYALWNLTSSDPETAPWEAIHAGADLFEKQS